MSNPYNFLTEFDEWFEYAKCIHHYKWTHEQACVHVSAIGAGWELCRPGKYGMWRMPNERCIKLDGVTIRASG